MQLLWLDIATFLIFRKKILATFLTNHNSILKRVQTSYRAFSSLSRHQQWFDWIGWKVFLPSQKLYINRKDKISNPFGYLLTHFLLIWFLGCCSHSNPPLPTGNHTTTHHPSGRQKGQLNCQHWKIKQNRFASCFSFFFLRSLYRKWLPISLNRK